jgi:hypothetical protein
MDVSTIDANELAFGDQAFVFIGDDAFSDIGQIRAFNDGQGRTIVQGNVDADALAEFEIELDGAPVVSAGDFIL